MVVIVRVRRVMMETMMKMIATKRWVVMRVIGRSETRKKEA